MGPVVASDVPAPAWPESRSFGSAHKGSGFRKFQAKPTLPAQAWLWLALASGRGL